MTPYTALFERFDFSQKSQNRPQVILAITFLPFDESVKKQDDLSLSRSLARVVDQ
jgi:hypothetical protein